MLALFADVLDHIEWKYDFRCDGISTSIETIIVTCTTGIASGLFNFMLAKTGYIAPVYNAVTKITTGSVQPIGTQNVIIFGFVGIEIITAIISFILLMFFRAEKNIHKEQAEIEARRSKMTI